MKQYTRYQCEVCGTEWATFAMARACEGFQLPPCPVHPGQKVKVYERYDGPTDDEVVAVMVRPSFYIEYGTIQNWEADHGDAAYDLMIGKHTEISFHQWHVQVQHNHMMNKDGYMTDTVTLDNIMVDGEYLKDAQLTDTSNPPKSQENTKE